MRRPDDEGVHAMIKGEPIHILLVEDDPAHSEAVRRALKASGMNVVVREAGTLRAYRELAAAHPPDIAILDLSLPDGRAPEVLISPPEAGPFPIVVMSSQGDEQKAVEAMKAGALDYIVKSPEAFAGMPRTVERVLNGWDMLQERKRAEEELRKSEERFKLIFEYAPDAYYLNDLKGNFIDGNKAAEKTTGYKREELIGGSFLKLNLLSLDQLPKAAKLLIKNARGIATGPDEFILKRKTGEKVHVEIITYPVKFENKTVVLGLARDITERKQGEEVIRASLREKEVLLREIHHRVKNNMQIISSLFNLQAGYIKDEEALRILKEGQTRIRSMALVHEKLYQSGDLSKIDLAGYIQSLSTHLFHVYLVDPNQVRLETEYGDVTLDINSAVPCGLILNELISNALKHAFPAGRKGVLMIRLRRGKDGAVELRIADNGVGFPKGLDFRRTESLGLQIVSLLVGQLEGTIKLDGKNGTAFTVAFHEMKQGLRT
jgi:PAS domain S-box-containing protein